MENMLFSTFETDFNEYQNIQFDVGSSLKYLHTRYIELNPKITLILSVSK